MHQNVSLWCTVQVITSEHLVYNTTLGIVTHTLVQFYGGVTANVGLHGSYIGLDTLTTAIGIVLYLAAGKAYLNIFLHTTSLTAAIDTAGNGATLDIHLVPDGSGIAVMRFACHKVTTTAGAIDATTVTGIIA